MAIKFPDLPFGPSDLAPYISNETLKLHHGKHHRHYVSALNVLIAGSEYDKMKLEDIMLKSFDKDEDVFHLAAQAWNHDFFCNSLSPRGLGKPMTKSLNLINKNFGTFSGFKDQFVDTGAKLFGSGWIWLIKNIDETLSIVGTENAGNPLTQGMIPLLVCDVWEHAYYLDYHHEREKFLNQFWKIVNWSFVEENIRGTEMNISHPPERGRDSFKMLI